LANSDFKVPAMSLDGSFRILTDFDGGDRSLAYRTSRAGFARF